MVLLSDIDDVLDQYGDAVGSDLAAYEQSLQARLKSTPDKAAEIRANIDLVNYMRLSHLELMLAAMDSIIDKAEGTVEASRVETIDTAVSYLQGNLTKLDDIAETSEERNLAGNIRQELTQLEKGVQVLIALI